MAKNKTLVLHSRPEGMLREENFQVVEREVPAVKQGQFLVRVHFASLDPGIRNLLAESSGYWVPTSLGEPLNTNMVGEVVESQHTDYRPGDLVAGTGALQEYTVFTPGPMTWKIDSGSRLPLSNHLGILGATGLTAYFGLLDVGKPVAGETVLVSAAAGAVGSAVGQIAKIRGCRVVGIAGGEEKCRRVIEEFGFDAAIDYRNKDMAQLMTAIGEHCPNGVDIYFENVGGIQLDAALGHMNSGGRVPCCGMISQYNGEGGAAMHNLFNIVAKTLRVEGFLCHTYSEQFPEALRDLEQWVAAGQLNHREHIEEGITAAPGVFVKLFTGENQGKTLVKVLSD